MQNPFLKAIPVRTDGGDNGSVNRYTDFFAVIDGLRTTQDTGAVAGRVVLEINADSEFAVWINGEFVMTGQHSQYPGRPVVETCEITDFLRPGTNALAIAVYRQGLTSSSYLQCRGQMIYEVTQILSGEVNGSVVAASSAETTLARLSRSYKSGPVPLVSGQLGYTFVFSGAENFADFISPGYTFEKAYEDGFAPAEEQPFEDGTVFVPRSIEKLAILEAGPASVVAQGVFDFGREYRETNTLPHAQYMQNAALKSMRFSELSVDPNRPRTLPAVENYMEHPCKEPAPAAGAVHFRTDKIVLSGALREGRGIYAVIDLGRETFGYLSFRLKVSRPTVCGIAYSDHLIDLRARAFVGGRSFAETVILPEGETAYTHLFSKIGGRYLQIFAETDDVTLAGLGIVPVRYPVDDRRRGTFLINDALHSKIFDTCLDTLLLCMNEHYMDCPQREQSLYAMDSRNQMLCGYYAFGEYAYAKESIRLLGQSLREEDGLLELCSPAKVSVTIPSFSLHWVIALCEYVRYSGDTEFFTEQLPVTNALMRAMLSRRTSAGCLVRWEGAEHWNFHEWSGELAGTIGSPNNTDADACLTALFIMATSLLADTINDAAPFNTSASERADMLRELAAGMRAGFNRTFFDTSAGTYASFSDGLTLRDYSQYTNALAILCGAAGLSETTYQGAVNALVGANLSVDVLPCTLSTTIFKYEALLSVSRDFIDTVMDEITSLWGHMLYNGATSFWETIVGAADFDDAGSLCHGWAAIPVVIYYKYILGINPTAPGFRNYDVNPVPWNGHYAEGSVYLPASKKVLRVETDGKSFSADTFDL
ncbi:MAG: hypothetical protein J6U38_00620 [Clostridia bacterium]|nr:hypothetical protein [Clostridia bacterium]MBO7658540.1 hypothetical protein [Clostridia bacterium]